MGVGGITLRTAAARRPGISGPLLEDTTPLWVDAGVLRAAEAVAAGAVLEPVRQAAGAASQASGAAAAAAAVAVAAAAAAAL